MGNLEQLSSRIENITLDIIKMSNIISTDSTILNTLSTEPDINLKNDFKMKNPEKYTSEDMLRISKVENQINLIKNNIFLDYNAHVIIIGADGTMYFSMDNFGEELTIKNENMESFLNQDWFKTIKADERRVMWSVPYSYDMEGLDGNTRHISLAKAIKNNYSPQNMSGILMINFSEKNLKQITGKYINGYFALLNEAGKIIFSSDKTMESQILENTDITSRNLNYGSGHFFTYINNQKYMVNYDSMDRFGWCSISLMPYKEITKEINTLKMKTYFLNIIIFAAFLFIGMALVLYTINPLKKLVNRLKKMKVGAYSVGLKNNENLDDVNGLVNSFEDMVGRVEELVGIVVQEQKLENDLRYEALRAQINPHFLFNTLSTIKWSAKMSGANNVSKMISSLGKLLEVSMNKGEEEISIRQEFELVESYVYIQNVRYNDKFELLLNVQDEKIYEYKVLKLILQPLVENSIIHGFAEKESDCTITIYAEQSDESVVITVKDNGIGFDSDKVEQRINIKERAKQKFTGIGLKNIQERIKLKYGEDYGLDISSRVEEGTTISIVIPKIENTEKVF